ncbi:MAG: sulfotransferase domain-containing protein [Candidatus Heimdallarchaeota archaeon]
MINLFRKLTNNARVLPDFIIAGAMKSGTSFLINFLSEHPYIKIPAYQKEIHFFDNHFYNGINWYKSYFPTKISRQFYRKFKKINFITGEKSPYYIFHPLVPQRIYSLLPKVKIIILLRNPVKRAYSHYNHSVRNKRENLTFEEAIKKETERLKGEKDKIIKSRKYRSRKYANYSYLTRGIYVNQIKNWYKYFPKEQILVIKSEEMYRYPQDVMNRVYEFLGLPKMKHKQFKKVFSHEYTKMDEKMSEYLKEYFKPYNLQLYDYLNVDYNWEEEK